MNGFGTGRVRVSRLYATGTGTVSPSDDRLGAFCRFLRDLQSTFTAYAAIGFVFGRDRAFYHKQVFAMILLHGFLFGGLGLFAGSSHQGFRIVE